MTYLRFHLIFNLPLLILLSVLGGTWPWTAGEGQAFGLVLLAVMRHFRPSLRAHGLTEQQWRILRALAASGDIEVTELARLAYLLGPSLSRILRDLEGEHAHIACDLEALLLGERRGGERVHTAATAAQQQRA